MNKAFFTLSLCLVAQSTQLSAMEAAPKPVPPIIIHNYPTNYSAGSSVFRYACYAAIIGGGYFVLRRFDPFSLIKRYIYGMATFPLAMQNTVETVQETKTDVKSIIEKIDATDREIAAFRTHFDNRVDTLERNTNARFDGVDAALKLILQHVTASRPNAFFRPADPSLPN